MWRKKGFIVEEGPNVRLAEGVAASASPEARAKEINDAFASDAKLILSVGGGETMYEILPYVDFDAIRKSEPKWFMGFSDNTHLTFLLPTLCDTAAIYGPCAGSFFMKKWRCSEADALAILEGATHSEGYPKWSITRTREDRPLWGYRLTQPKIITPYQYEKPFEGTLLGGCMDVLLGLKGTKYDQVAAFNKAHPEGVIWFMEAFDFNSLLLRHAYWQLRQAGWFDNAKGFLIGRPRAGWEEIMGVDRFNAATDILGSLGVPILFDVDVSHLGPTLPIKTGIQARVAFEKGNLIIDYSE